MKKRGLGSELDKSRAQELNSVRAVASGRGLVRVPRVVLGREMRVWVRVWGARASVVEQHTTTRYSVREKALQDERRKIIRSRGTSLVWKLKTGNWKAQVGS